MPHFVMLTRLSHNGNRIPKGLMDLEGRVVENIRKQCPDVKWLHSYAVLGPSVFRTSPFELRPHRQVSVGNQ